jgi:3-oxoacyl-[acyl-carrier protein] reductase
MSEQHDRVFVIFGATGGIGLALARRLSADSRNRLLLAGRHKERLDEIAKELNVSTFEADATNLAAVEGCLEQAVERFGRLDGVANCVGSLLLKPLHLTSESEWQSTININLGSAFAVTRASVKSMMSTGGSIALVSSAAARIGLANHEAIAAAKGAIEGLVLSAAATYAPKGIRVNAVAPGLVRTPMTTRITGNEMSLKASVAMHALGRIGEPDDVASGLAWLLNPAQQWVTGQIIGIDGGLGSLRSR